MQVQTLPATITPLFFVRKSVDCLLDSSYIAKNCFVIFPSVISPYRDMRSQGFRFKLLLVVLCAPSFLGVLPGSVGVQTWHGDGRTSSESEHCENESKEDASSHSALRMRCRQPLSRNRITAFAKPCSSGTSSRLRGEIGRHTFFRSMRAEHSSRNGVSAPLIC